MRYSNYIEKPASYSKEPETCVFRFCTEEAITTLMVEIADIEAEGEEDNALIPVCRIHRDIIEKSRDKKGAR